jgi:hypothetical protein
MPNAGWSPFGDPKFLKHAGRVAKWSAVSGALSGKGGHGGGTDPLTALINLHGTVAGHAHEQRMAEINNAHEQTQSKIGIAGNMLEREQLQKFAADDSRVTHGDTNWTRKARGGGNGGAGAPAGGPAGGPTGGAGGGNPGWGHPLPGNLHPGQFGPTPGQNMPTNSNSGWTESRPNRPALGPARPAIGAAPNRPAANGPVLQLPSQAFRVTGVHRINGGIPMGQAQPQQEQRTFSASNNYGTRELGPGGKPKRARKSSGQPLQTPYEKTGNTPRTRKPRGA